MRLATVIDLDLNETHAVLEFPGGDRVPMRELLHNRAADSRQPPIDFADLATTFPYLDDVVDAARHRVKGETRAHTARNFKFLPPIPRPGSFRDFWAFDAHVKAMRARAGLAMPPAFSEQPVFYFGNAGALVGHETPVFAPHGGKQLDFELELGVIIGAGGRDIAVRDAWKHVAGFTIVNDFTARDIQATEDLIGSGRGKSKDFATAVGPYLVTLDELRDRIDDGGRLHANMVARLNGKEITRSNASTMHFSWPQVIEAASRDAELYPGDLIGSGTVGGGCIAELGPENVGGWLKAGDIIELEIDRLGILRTPIIERPPTRTS